MRNNGGGNQTQAVEAIEPPETHKDRRFWEGEHTVVNHEERIRIANLLGFYGEKDTSEDIPIELVEFKRGFNGRESLSMTYTACSSSKTTCGDSMVQKVSYKKIPMELVEYRRAYNGREYRLHEIHSYVTTQNPRLNEESSLKF